MTAPPASGPPPGDDTPGLTDERQITARIVTLNNELGELYLKRAGLRIDDRRAWCACCGRTSVTVADGYDTCPACAPRP